MPIKLNKLIDLWSKSRFLIIIFITLAIIMIVSALVELNQSKKELFELMDQQAESLIESIITSSENSHLANEQLNYLIEQRLLNNAVLISYLHRDGEITNNKLNEICISNNLFRINIFNNKGDKIFYSHEQIHSSIEERYSPKQLFDPLFKGMVDTLIVGVLPARNAEGNRFTIAIAGKDRNVIEVNIDAEQILHFRKSIGFGPMLRVIVQDNPYIMFAALQDTNSILAASGNVTTLDAIQSSEFLTASLNDTVFATRTAEFESSEVYEIVKPFNYKNSQVGLLRLGLSMEPIHEINQRIVRRLIIISIVLFVIGSIILALLFILQRLGILRKQYSVVETYSSNIINSASDAIIVYNDSDGVKIFNKSAERLFDVKESDVLESDLDNIFSSSDTRSILESESNMIQLKANINMEHKYLLISKTDIIIDTIPNSILLIRDLTEQKLLEEQLERNTRLSAMGELASGVAHEIRNPLNSISTIVQQLDKDFSPNENSEEYHELSNIVYKEIQRINKTIEEFLQFSKPEVIKSSLFKIDKLFNELEKQYSSLLSNKNIVLDVKQKWKGIVKWDYDKMKQVFINLIDNAVDAIKQNGTIKIITNKIDDTTEIQMTDSGEGIKSSNLNKIFNLYYTSKASGTGVGLSIVQRIVQEHQGTISVNSELKKGTTFTLSIPISDK